MNTNHNSDPPSSTRKWPYFNFTPNDWLGSRHVRMMDPEQRGWLIQLVCEAWVSEEQNRLPNDDKFLRKLAGAENAEDAKWFEVRNQFAVIGKWRFHRRLERELERCAKFSAQASAAGKASGAARAQKKKSAQPPSAPRQFQAEKDEGEGTDVERQLNGRSFSVEQETNHSDSDSDSDSKILEFNSLEASSTGTRPNSDETVRLNTLLRHFSEKEQNQWGGLWRNRLRENPSAFDRLAASIGLDIREGKALRNVGGYADDLWKRLPETQTA